MNTTNWEQIEKRAMESEKALDYMREHPLTHEQAVEQTQRFKETGFQKIQGTSPCPNPKEESEYDFSNPKNVVAKINFTPKNKK